MKTIGVDVGGTFTDLIFFDPDTGDLGIHKVPTTPDDPSRGVIEGINAICDLNGFQPEDIDHVFHGTTTATNAFVMCCTSGATNGLSIIRSCRNCRGKTAR
jgi:N-methylhydantoinase A